MAYVGLNERWPRTWPMKVNGSDYRHIFCGGAEYFVEIRKTGGTTIRNYWTPRILEETRGADYKGLVILVKHPILMQWGCGLDIILDVNASPGQP